MVDEVWASKTTMILDFEAISTLLCQANANVLGFIRKICSVGVIFLQVQHTGPAKNHQSWSFNHDIAPFPKESTYQTVWLTNFSASACLKKPLVILRVIYWYCNLNSTMGWDMFFGSYLCISICWRLHVLCWLKLIWTRRKLWTWPWVNKLGQNLLKHNMNGVNGVNT